MKVIRRGDSGKFLWMIEHTNSSLDNSKQRFTHHRLWQAYKWTDEGCNGRNIALNYQVNCWVCLIVQRNHSAMLAILYQLMVMTSLYFIFFISWIWPDGRNHIEEGQPAPHHHLLTTTSNGILHSLVWPDPFPASAVVQRSAGGGWGGGLHNSGTRG